MKKVLFLSILMPTRLGGMRSLYHNMAAFSKKSAVHFIRLDCGLDERRVPLGLPPGVHFSTIRCPGLSADPLSFLFPMQWKLMARLRSAQEQVQEYIDANGIDAVVLHSMDVTFALRGLRARAKSGYQLDSFSAYYSSKWRFSRSLQVLLFGLLQSALYCLTERVLLRNYDLLAYVSRADAPQGSGKVVSMCQAQDPPLQKKNPGRRDLDVLLFGRWEHPPNRDGLARVAARLGEIKGSATVIGPNIQPGLSFPPNVEVLGMVEGIEGYQSRAKVCLIPVWYGAGLQTKVFDALRHGCVVASTHFTKGSFEANGFSSDSIIASDDPVASAKEALASWSPADSEAAYESYEKFHAMNRRLTQEYVRRVLEIASRKPVAQRAGLQGRLHGQEDYP